ncbi:MAG: hypothetical protein HYV97_04715 [Bdellovibrio sp.]|nr:hypothetical protein [Bdellovibrio sp.]
MISIILFALLFLAFLLYYFYQTYAMSISGSGSLHLLNVSISIENAFHFIIYSGAFLFVASVAYYLFFKDVMGAKFQASQKHIACHRKKKEFKIFFEEITSLHCGSFGPLCTFRIKCNNGRVYRFSTMIERADYIIEAILRFNPKLLPWEKFVAFRNKLVLSDHRLARFEESYYGRHSWISVFHLAFLPIVFLSWLYIQQANKMVIHSIVGHVLIGLKLIIITNLGLWGLYQFIYKRIIDKKSFEKLQKNIKDKKRDMHYESTLYKSLYAGVVTLCFVFYSGIYNFDLNRYEFIVALENFENYGQSAGTVHLVDTRYNCQECNFSLKHGDVVVILKPDRPGKYLAKISGFPGEVVKFNDLQDVQTGRSVAAYEERKLNKHELSAITGKKGEYVSLLSEEQIYGKVAMKVMTLPKFNQNFFASMLKISE